MAWSKTEYPYTLAPGFNVNWVQALNTTDYNNNSFRYSFDVRMTDIGGTFTPGLTGTSLGTFYLPPRPVTGEALFNPSGIWKDNLVTPLDPVGASGGGATGTGYKQTQVTYNYEYVSATGASITGTPITGATKRTWGGIFGYEEFPAYDWTDWEIGPNSSNVLFLTDGPSSRCLLANDLLYCLVGPSGPSSVSWGMENTIQNDTNWAADGFGAAWQQVANPDSTGGTDLNWLASDGDGLYTLGYDGYNSYSNILYPVPSPNNGTVFLKSGGTYNVRVLTDQPYSAQFVGVWLYGKRQSNGVWEQIGQLSEFNNGGDAEYRINGTASTTYTNLGLATDAGYNVGGYFTTVLAWNYVNPAGTYQWEINPTVGATAYYAVDNGKLNYLNVGSIATGQSGDFTVRIVNSDTKSAYTETITYDADCNTCSSCEKVTLTWLNSKGGYDAFQFHCVNTKELSATRQQAEQFLGKDYTVGMRGFINPKNTVLTTKTVNTQFTGQTNIEWLESLFVSPSVYELRDDNTLIPVIMLSDSYSTWVSPDKIKIAEFQYQLGYSRTSQTI
jgi:hypothetical protein